MEFFCVRGIREVGLNCLLFVGYAKLFSSSVLVWSLVLDLDSDVTGNSRVGATL